MIMWQVEVGEAVTGSEYYELAVEKPGYLHSWGRGGKRFVPSAVFCPQCSKIREHNPKSGKVELKRNPTEDDFCWNIVYDETLSFGICGSCGWELKEKVPDVDFESRAVGEDHAVEQEWIGEAVYEDGYFWLSSEDYQSMFQVVIKAHRQKLNLSPAVLVAESGYLLNNKTFLQVAKDKQYKEEEGRIGIPRQCWQSL
jgi:hypothetical protein